MADVDKLQESLMYITENPEKHDQQMWGAALSQYEWERHTGSVPPDAKADMHSLPVCNTAGCLAGWTAVLNGYVFVTGNGNRYMSSVMPVGNLKKGRLDEASVVARRLLGLSGEEAEDLFNPDNTIVDLWAIAYAITHGAIRLPSAIPVQGLYGERQVRQRVASELLDLATNGIGSVCEYEAATYKERSSYGGMPGLLMPKDRW